jgi:hypothetical protein
MTKNELPDHIQVGIQHFENIPEVEAPVDFHDDGEGSAQFSFHTIVRVRADGETATVEEQAETLDAAWEAFQLSMSKRITEVAVSDAEDSTA